MTNRFELYRHVGHRLVGGWLAPEVLAITAVLDAAQRSKGVTGAVAEIGVHHGKFFIALNCLQRDGEPSVAVDVFGDQDLNLDSSGRGDVDIFRKNVERWSSLETVTIHTGDSTKLTPESLRGIAGTSIRLFSVDGGHTEAIVSSDMRVAEATLSEGGIVIADDIFNEQWPEVLIGTFAYLAGGGRLVPFIIGFNKVFFALPEDVDHYRNAATTHFAPRLLVYTKNARFAGHEVLVIGRTPRNRLRQWFNYRC